MSYTKITRHGQNKVNSYSTLRQVMFYVEIERCVYFDIVHTVHITTVNLSSDRCT